MRREQEQAIIKDLHKKMVLLAGPRQAGKTTLAKEISKKFSSAIYLNFDRAHDRKIMQEEAWPPSTELLIFDEIHKMERWKNYLKGIYDTKPEGQKILVTGSARLEIFREAGDSLAGRYFMHRLLPLTPAECFRTNTAYTLDRFLERGGFPEPFLDRDEADADRWRKLYIDTLLREDVLDFESIQNVKAIRLVFDLLREKVGSPLSFSSIAEDVQVSPHTVKKYIQILEALYIVFKITPFSQNIARSLLKEPKIYFYDTGLVKGSAGARFENLVAISLLKEVYGKVDLLGKEYALHYLQTKDKQEVDFAVVKEGSIETLIEAKLSDRNLAAGIRYFHSKYNLKAIQLVKELKQGFMAQGVEISDAKKFLENLNF